MSVGDIVPELLKMSEDMAEKLQKARQEFYDKLGFEPDRVNCTKHPGQICEFDEEKSLAIFFSQNKLELKYHPCKKCAEEILVNEKCYKWRKMGVPQKLQTATFHNYEAKSKEQREALDEVKGQAAKQRGFILMVGKNGCGKSHLAVAVLKFMGGGVFVIEDDLIADLRRTYDEGGRERMMNKYKTCRCLVVDEVDAQLKGDDINPLLYNILA